MIIEIVLNIMLALLIWLSVWKVFFWLSKKERNPTEDFCLRVSLCLFVVPLIPISVLVHVVHTIYIRFDSIIKGRTRKRESMIRSFFRSCNGEFKTIKSVWNSFNKE